ncbi:MAG: hypothetical protein IT562_08490 [Alphaproteobacteria bacterium]|nr:hypothetical protein [Alphaproteobacteria bacterium]
MSKLPALVSALSDCDERGRSTIEHIARVVREAGFIPTTKRGAGAAEMTIREAANLLIAANASETPKEAAMVITPYRALTPLHHRSSDDALPILSEILTAQNFGVALERLIELAPTFLGALSAHIDEAFKDDSEDGRAILKDLMLKRGHHAGIGVVFHRPTLVASIRLWLTNMRAEWHFNVDASLLMRGHYPDTRRDRETSVKVGLKTLLKLWAAVAVEDAAQ